jgi:transglutaminase-like putative cysteine protease
MIIGVLNKKNKLPFMAHKKIASMLLHQAINCLLLLCITFTVQAQRSNDENDADMYAKMFKDDGVICTSSYMYFTFDKGKNALNDKVVEIQELSEYDFMAIKRYASVTFAEFYNKFIQLNRLNKAIKVNGKFMVLERGGVDKSVTDDGVFFDDSRVQYYPMRFSKKGEMARITVKKNYSDGKYLTRLFFHDQYPIKEQTFEFKVPEWLTVDFKKVNFEGYNIEVREEEKKGYKHYYFTMKNVPAYKSEYRRIGRAYSDPHIIIQIKTFESKGETLKGFDKVDDVYNWNNRLYQMATNDKTKLTAQVALLTKAKNTEIEKTKAIYYWVQDNIRYIAYEDGFSGYIPSPVQDVFSKKYGDCKGMANLLTEMLKIAGIDAHFTWIGTRHLPYSQSVPALCVNNHAICTVYIGGKAYYLDGTESYGPFGENAFRIQGKEVMIANGDKFTIQTVPQSTVDDNKLSTKADFNLNGEVLSGKVKVVITGNERTDFHQEYQNLPSTSQKEFINDYLEFGNDNMVATNVKTSDLNNRELPITIDGDVDLSNTVTTISGNKYVGVDFFPKSLDKFIPDEKRIQGYDLDVVVKFEDEISLSIPAGKKFIDKPENLEIKFDGYEFKGEYTLVGNKMVLKKELSIKNSIVKKSDFANWKKFIESIKEFSRYLLSISEK